MKKRRNKFLEFWYSHTRLATAIILLLGNIALTLLFALVFKLITDISYWEALQYCTILAFSSDGIWTIKEMFGDPYDELLIVHIVIIIVQMVCFSGALIGFVTAVLSSLFDDAETLKKGLKLNDHYVILNWSALGPNIVYDLSFIKGKKTIVILADRDREVILNQIHDIFTENNTPIKNIRIFVKEGNPNSGQKLKEISIGSAKSVGILLDSSWKNETEDDGNLNARDLRVFRMLMSIVHLVKNGNIVVESESTQLEDKIKTLFSENRDLMNKIVVFSHNEVIGHILGKALINKDYVDFYNYVLSYDGAEFYGIPPMSMEEALENYNDFLPIVLYDDDDAIDEHGNKAADELYILDEDGNITKRKHPIKYDRTVNTSYKPVEESTDYFILGRSNTFKFVEEEINEFKSINSSEIKYKVYPYTDIAQMVEDANASNFKRKVVLICQNRALDNDKDAKIFLNLLALKTDYKLNDDIEVYVEVKMPSNAKSVENMGSAKTIISNKIISLYMIQLMTHPNSHKFYNDILIPNSKIVNSGIDFEIVNAAQCLDVKEPLIFECKAELAQVFYHSMKEKSMIVAYKNGPSDEFHYLATDMDKPENIIIDDNTTIIVTKYS